TVGLAASLDVAAGVWAARRPGGSWFCVEQPDRDRYALAAIGEAARIEARGPNRFREVAARCRELARDAECGDDLIGTPPGTGPVLCGGFAFADAGGVSPEWASFAPAQLVLPELSILRRGERAWLTLAAVVGADASADEAHERLVARMRDFAPAA